VIPGSDTTHCLCRRRPKSQTNRGKEDDQERGVLDAPFGPCTTCRAMALLSLSRMQIYEPGSWTVRPGVRAEPASENAIPVRHMYPFSRS
jgi:hypothetical protein